MVKVRQFSPTLVRTRVRVCVCVWYAADSLMQSAVFLCV